MRRYLTMTLAVDAAIDGRIMSASIQDEAVAVVWCSVWSVAWSDTAPSPIRIRPGPMCDGSLS